MQVYVDGILFDKSTYKVLLVNYHDKQYDCSHVDSIRKPIGEYETREDAIVRICKEITDIDTKKSDWRYFAEMMTHDYYSSFMKAVINMPVSYKGSLYDVRSLPKYVGSFIPFIVPLAVNTNEHSFVTLKY
jgi:hypothetical protein